MKTKLLLAVILVVFAVQAACSQINFPNQGYVVYGTTTAPVISSTFPEPFHYLSENTALVIITSDNKFQAKGYGQTSIVAYQYTPGTTQIEAAASANIFVTPAPLTITPVTQTIAWGQNPAPFTATYSGFLYGDTPANLPSGALPTMTSPYTQFSPAGKYFIFNGPTQTSNGGNYNITYATGSLFVTSIYPIPSATTLAPTNVTGTTATLNGVVNDAGSATTVTIGYTTNSDENPQQYTPLPLTTGTSPLPAGSGSTNFSAQLTGMVPGTTYYFLISASNPEYTEYGNIQSIPNTATQNQTITFAQPAAVTYGAADFAPVGTSTNNTIPITYTSSNPLVATITGSGDIHILAAGNTIITANQAGNATYNPAPPVPQTLTVNPAPLTITANNATRQQGVANPVFTANYSGFVNGDSQASLTAPPTITSTATTASPVGNYPITPAGAVDPNYTFSYVAATLNITVSHNAELASIKTSPLTTLVGTTGPGYLNFKATVAYSTTSIQVIPTAQDAYATITVNGSAVASGSASASIPLNVGANTITTIITAADGTTVKTVIIAVTRQTSNDALLTSIKTTPTSPLTIVAGPSYENYTTTVANTVSSIAVTPTAQDVNATITVNGATVISGTASGSIALTVGSNTINTVVTAQDGVTTKTYTITVTRLLQTDALLTSIKLTPATPLTVVAGPGYVNYTASVSNATSSVTVTPTTQDATATVKVNGTTVASGTASGAIALVVGSNTINTVVTAQDGVTTKTYTITLTRAPSTDALLTSLKTTPASSLTIVAGPDYVDYTTTVANATSSITVTPTVQDATATVTVNGFTVNSGTASQPIALALGSNTISTVVTAQDGITTKTYSITVTRPLSADALLTSLKLTPAETLTIVAGPDYVDYTASVHNTTSSVTVTPTAQDATATITVNGTTVASGAASQSIALAVGPNTINTVVTAQDGTTSKTYSIAITRAMTGMNSYYEPISVTKPTNSPSIENDGIVVHQGVSPNGDGINDYLTIDGISNYPDNSLKIIDRNGLVVYQTKGYNNASKPFDGHSSLDGRMQLPGTYFYSLDYAVDGQSKHKTGYIILKY